MSDLVERLRACAEPNNFHRGSLYGACRQAADEIERLTKQLVIARAILREFLPAVIPNDLKKRAAAFLTDDQHERSK